MKFLLLAGVLVAAGGPTLGADQGPPITFHAAPPQHMAGPLLMQQGKIPTQSTNGNTGATIFYFDSDLSKWDAGGCTKDTVTRTEAPREFTSPYTSGVYSPDTQKLRDIIANLCKQIDLYKTRVDTLTRENVQLRTELRQAQAQAKK